MRTRHLHPAAFLVIIPLSLGAVVWAFGSVARLLFPLMTNVVTNGLGSWVFPATDEHCIGKAYMTQQSTDNRNVMTPTHMAATTAATTTAASGAGTNTPFLLDYYYRHTTCAILGMVLLLPLAVCVSILVSRSYVKIPVDLTHIYTSWNQHHDDSDSFLVAPSTPIPPKSGEAVIVSSSSSPTPSPTPSPQQPSIISAPMASTPSSAIMDSQEKHFSVHSPAAIEIPTETTPDSHTLPTKADNTEVHLASQSLKSNKEQQHHQHLSTATLIDKRKKKRPKQTKKKERGKRDASLEEAEKEPTSPVKHQKQQQQQQQHQKSYKGSIQSPSPSSPHPSQKMSSSICDHALVNHHQSMIIVPPPPPPPPPHSPRSVNLTSAASPGTPIVTQKIPYKLTTPTSTNDNRAPPSPAVSPKDYPSTSAKHGSKTMPIIPSPASVQQHQQPMVTKLIANKKDPLPAPAAPLAPFTSKPKSAPLTSPASITSTGNAVTDVASRQSWYSPFNTGLNFDLLSRSPPSPATSCLPLSSSSSLNRTDYRLLPDSSYHRLSSTKSSSTGVYPYLQQQQQQSNQQTHHHHQHQHQPHLHQQPHSLQYRHNSQPHSHYQPSHVGQHHTSYDYLLYGTLPKAPPMQVSPPPPCIESSSSIADLPPPTPPPAELVATRLPTPPVSLSPVIAPPTLPSTREKDAESATFPFSMWYPWKPRPLSTTEPDEEASPSFSLFDRKLSFHSSGA